MGENDECSIEENTDMELEIHCTVCNVKMGYQGIIEGDPHFKCPDCEYEVKIIKED